jgi:putative tricarboxylic transport membrane protein
VLSGLILAGSAARTRRETESPAEPEQTNRPADSSEPAAPTEPPVPWRRLVLMIGLFAAYVMAFIPLGFVTATAAYLFATSTLIDPEHRLRNACFAVAFSIIVYLLFTRLLAVHLPPGLIG